MELSKIKETSFELATIYEAMREGIPISNDEREKAVENLENLADDFAQRGMIADIGRIRSAIDRINSYKAIKKKPGPRSKHDINVSMSYAALMCEQAGRDHKPITEAKWRHIFDEYRKEYECAVLGECYEPRIHE